MAMLICAVMQGRGVNSAGKTYSNNGAHCQLGGLNEDGQLAKCRRRANTLAKTTTQCQLKDHYGAAQGDTWCVYQRHGFLAMI